MIAATGHRVGDVLEPERTDVADLAIRTDGDWVWPADLAYYVERYGTALPADFVERMQALDWNPPALSDDDSRRSSPTCRRSADSRPGPRVRCGSDPVCLCPAAGKQTAAKTMRAGGTVSTIGRSTAPEFCRPNGDRIAAAGRVEAELTGVAGELRRAAGPVRRHRHGEQLRFRDFDEQWIRETRRLP